MGVLILASVSLGGCIGDGETEDQSRFIDDESELFDPESPDYCGDFDGDGLSDVAFVGQGWSGRGLNIRTKFSRGDGTWSSGSHVLGDGSGVHRYPTLLGDFDGDHQL